MKRVFIIHGWSGSPEGGWLGWLKGALEAEGFKAIAPQMPGADEPKIETWIPFLAELVGAPDGDTFFVGHSIGCQTIMRYLQTIYPKKTGGAVFVAGWFNLKGLEGPDEEKLASSWMTAPINFEKIKTAAGKFLAILSDTDPYVPIGDAEIFKEKLGAEVIIETGKGHFTSDDGAADLPIALEKLLEMAEKK